MQSMYAALVIAVSPWCRKRAPDSPYAFSRNVMIRMRSLPFRGTKSFFCEPGPIEETFFSNIRHVGIILLFAIKVLDIRKSWSVEGTIGAAATALRVQVGALPRSTWPNISGCA